MSHRVLRWLIALCVLCSASIVSAQERIVAIGDLHGDFAAWQAITRAAGLSDARGRWVGGRTLLVQTGDVTDRGPASLRIIEQLMRWQREAPRAGGRVIVLTGNHEAMMVTGDLRYVHPGEYAAFVDRNSARLRDALFRQLQDGLEQQAKARDPTITRKAVRDAWYAQTPLGLIEHRRAWAPDGRLGRWAATNPVAVKIGDTLFVHGGISAEYARLSLDQINQQAASELASASTSEKALINDPLGPLWYRGLVTRAQAAEEAAAAPAPPSVQLPARPSIEQELATVLAAYGAKRIVVGHTPSLRGIVADQGGRLIRIDTGISGYYNGSPSYLEIIGDRLIPHGVPRPAVPAKAQ